MVWLALVLGAIVLVGGALALSHVSEVRWKLRCAEHDAAFWEREAKRMGWKNPFEELADSLRQSTELIKAAAESLRQANDRRNADTEKLRALNRTLRETAERMKAPNAALEAATARLESARAALPGARPPAALPPHVPEPAAALTGRTDAPLLNEVLRRVEQDAASGRVETDPKKLN